MRLIIDGLQTRRTPKQAATEELLAVQQVPGLARVFMFHGDGRIREEAIRHLDGPLNAPANVYALYWRLNDWAPQVRDASIEAVNRVMPSTSAMVIAPALKAILPHVHSCGRWSAEGPKAVDEILLRANVAALLLEDVMTTRQSGLGLIFRELCKATSIDPHIERVFRTAHLPHIRTMALDMLLSRKMRWPTGKTRRVWIDRSMGEYRSEPVLAERELAIDVDANARAAPL